MQLAFSKDRLNMKKKAFILFALIFAVLAADAPTFLELFEFITVKEGTILQVSCQASGAKPITYEWYQDKGKIPEDPSAPVSVRNTGEESILFIREVRKSQEGTYTCVATNSHGSLSKVYELKVEPLTEKDTTTTEEATDGEPAILSVQAKNISSNSVQFAFNVSSRFDSIEVKYIEKQENITHNRKWEYGSEFVVSDLIPSGLYSFQFRALPSNTAVWTNAYNVTLLPDAPELILRSLDAGILRIEWFRKTDDIFRKTIDQYELKYFTVQMERGSTWKPSDCEIKIQIPSCSGSGHTISGLYQNVYYQIQLRAHTASGFSEPYSQKIFIPR